MIALLASLTVAADLPQTLPPEQIEQALVAEMSRAKDLSLPEAPPLYHVRYQLLNLRQVDVQTSLGALIRAETDPYLSLGIEVRVGTPQFDNSGFGGWQNGFGSTGVPDRLTAQALRLEAWSLTDTNYKQAVEQYARKQAQFTPPPEYPGDYVMSGPTTFVGADAVPPRLDSLQDRAMVVGAVFANGERIERGDVYVGAEAGERYLVDTDGSRIRTPSEEVTIRAALQVRASDGLLLTDARLWSVRREDLLPATDVMRADVEAMRDHLLTLANAPSLDEEYVGPVVFEDGAAVDLFRWILVNQLEGTPPDVPFDAWFGELGGDDGGAVRIDRRVLPQGWEVYDDPTTHPESPAHFDVDMEGTAAQRVDLVEDGIVKTVLMSRVPRADLKESNGHARGMVGYRAQGRAAVMTVEPDKHVSMAALHKRAKKLALAYGHDHWIVVRRLQEPAIRSLGSGGGGFFMFGSSDDAGALPPPVSIFLHYADGHEVELKGARFAGVQRFVLRDIVAAGPQRETTYMAPALGDSSSLGPTEGLATWLSAPDVLVGEMELVPMAGDPRDLPVVPAPKVKQ